MPTPPSSWQSVAVDDEREPRGDETRSEEEDQELASRILDRFEALLAAAGVVVPSDDGEDREEEA